MSEFADTGYKGPVGGKEPVPEALAQKVLPEAPGVELPMVVHRLPLSPGPQTRFVQPSIMTIWPDN
jgi:hypothetical protein